MKLLALIVQLLVWLLVAFACTPKGPVKPMDDAQSAATVSPTATKWAVSTMMPDVTPTPVPAYEDNGSRSSKSNSSRSSNDDDSDDNASYSHSSRTSVPEHSHDSGEDTQMPEIGGDDSGSDDEHYYYDDSDYGSDTLLPEI